MRRFLLTGILSLAALAAAAQPPQRTLRPEEYIYPVKGVDGSCSANFGEMRPGHFHGGVDIRTGGAEGKVLVASADGYISRVSVAPGGYGRAVYIALNNGTTAVYGHLLRFNKQLARHIDSVRYARKVHSVNLYFDAGMWPVKQGDIIGYSGNSGSSMGPHLHYEVRDTRTQGVYNPVKQGLIQPADTTRPRIMKLHYIEVDSLDSGVCVNHRRDSYQVVRKKEGVYRLTLDTPVKVGRKGIFIAEVTDRRNGVHNRFGIWRVSAFDNGEKFFEYQMNGFTFDESRFCDAVSYFPLQVKSRTEVIRLHQLEMTPDHFYTAMRERGLIRTEEGERRKITVEAEDDSGNTSTLTFEIEGRKGEFRAPLPDSTAVLLSPRRDENIAWADAVTVHIPAGVLYEKCYARPEVVKAPKLDTGVVVLSPAYRLLPPLTPMKAAAKVTVRADIPAALRVKASLALRGRTGRSGNLGGIYANGGVTASTSAAGDVFVVADTLPPFIRPRFKSGADLSKSATIGFTVGDNFSGVSSYSLYIDDRWVVCDRYPMKGLLYHKFDTPRQGKTHRVKLILRDGAGNKRIWQGRFFR